MPRVGIEVEGLQELLSSLRRVNRVVVRELQAELRDIGQDLKTRVQHYIIGRGLYDPERAPDAITGTAGAGPMVDKVYVQVAVGRVFVVERQRRRSKGYPGGYDYPARYEFGQGGRRSFMRPALEAERAVLTPKLEAWFAKVIAEARW